MMRASQILPALGLLGLTLATPQSAPMSEQLHTLYQHQKTFALDLHRALVGANTQGNAFASPLSIWTALSMLSGGAVGQTARELASALFDDAGMDATALRADLQRVASDLRGRLEELGEGTQLAWADALWSEASFSLDPQVIKALREHYGARLESLDFMGAPEAARQTINSWVAQQTRDRIRDLLPQGSVTNLTRIVLTDAVWFKGSWSKAFPDGGRKLHPFQRSDGASLVVPFISDEKPRKTPVAFLPDEREPESAETDLIAFELPYGEDSEEAELALLVLLPDDPAGLTLLEQELTAERLDAITAALQRREVFVALPKIKMAPAYDLSRVFRDMGLEHIFEPDGGLDGFASEGQPGLFVSGGFHKAFLEIDEQGTEAAAATGIVVGARAMPPPTPRITADRPFLFLIRERSTGAVLFIGRLADPSAG